MPALNLTVSDELSELEARVLDHLARTLRPGFCPSREELSRAAGLGGRGYRISRILESLEQKGFLRLAPGCSRPSPCSAVRMGVRFGSKPCGYRWSGLLAQASPARLPPRSTIPSLKRR